MQLRSKVFATEYVGLPNRDRPRFFDQVGHQTTNASIGNKYFFIFVGSVHNFGKSDDDII